MKVGSEMQHERTAMFFRCNIKADGKCFTGASTHASTLNNPSYVRSALLAVSAIGVFLLVFIFIYLIYSSYCKNER